MHPFITHDKEYICCRMGEIKSCEMHVQLMPHSVRLELVLDVVWILEIHCDRIGNKDLCIKTMCVAGDKTTFSV